ncbi:uncharacterized protein LOC113502898 isoform X2 [Trichoplusia ni]|uniref:Uncharacterized protein LOC113502898 isoform X2 n=1 Tax=Trichoplusia ni TaxID=7111 RepID=A0A7E5WJY6_TRINI|nr:uncharacterized protein LOC113502898 isoform X2 [Trichoplusia ni]
MFCFYLFSADTDPQRRALIKEKTNKYLSYAEDIYKNHLCDTERSLLPEPDDNSRSLHCPIPLSMLKRPYEDLSLYRVLDILGNSMMLVLHKTEQAYYAMKVIQKVPNNLTEFDEFFVQRANETRQPILPTVIPYMVPLQAYIETSNLIFLILSYAPGKKLFDYIKNYTKSLPTTPAREVNLENVFTEPKNKNSKVNDNEVESVANNNEDVSVNELVLNSQKLLINVDRVLSETKVEVKEDTKDCKVDNACGSPSINRSVVITLSAAARSRRVAAVGPVSLGRGDTHRLGVSAQLRGYMQRPVPARRAAGRRRARAAVVPRGLGGRGAAPVGRARVAPPRRAGARAVARRAQRRARARPRLRLLEPGRASL